MTYGEMLAAIERPDLVEKELALDMDVEFWTLDQGRFTLLSVYAHDGKIYIDLGIEED